MITNTERGVILIVTFLVMTIMLAVVLGISTILFNEVKIASNAGSSFTSFYAAEAGVEKTLYFDRKWVPNGAAVNRGLCNMCSTCSSGSDSTACNSCTTINLATDASNGCDINNCKNCEVTYNTTFDGETHTIDAKVYPDSITGGSNFNVVVKGTYRDTTRTINVNSDEQTINGAYVYVLKTSSPNAVKRYKTSFNIPQTPMTTSSGVISAPKQVVAAAHGDFVYIPDIGSATHSVYRFRANDLTLTPVGFSPPIPPNTVNSWPISVAVSPNNSACENYMGSECVYVVTKQGSPDSLYKLQSSTTYGLTELRHVSLSTVQNSNPVSVTISPDSNYVYVFNWVYLQRYNTSDLSLANQNSSNPTLQLISGSASANEQNIVISPDGQYIYVIVRDSVSGNGFLQKINTCYNPNPALYPGRCDLRVEQTSASLGSDPGFPNLVAVSGDSNYVYVNMYNTFSLKAFNAADLSCRQNPPDPNPLNNCVSAIIHNQSNGISISPDGNYVYTVGLDNSIRKLNASSLTNALGSPFTADNGGYAGISVSVGGSILSAIPFYNP